MARFKSGDLVALNCDIRDYHVSYPTRAQDWVRGQAGIVLQVVHEGYLTEKSVQVLVGDQVGWFYASELDPVEPPLSGTP